eukprot:UN10882
MIYMKICVVLLSFFVLNIFFVVVFLFVFLLHDEQKNNVWIFDFNNMITYVLSHIAL